MAAGVATGIWSGDVTRPSGFPGICGIVAIIVAYRLVKRINKSQLWANASNFNSSANNMKNWILILIGLAIVFIGVTTKKLFFLLFISVLPLFWNYNKL